MNAVLIISVLASIAFAQFGNDSEVGSNGWNVVAYSSNYAEPIKVVVSEKYGSTVMYKTMAIFESDKQIKLVSSDDTHIFPIENISHIEIEKSSK